ncbi:hypothetical protein [Shewanella sp. 1180_01]|uniref:hypothetical protein n=1 Tax=Shewanella sp. 1180_01 TaxID=2604451 RepID=UPI0040635F04
MCNFFIYGFVLLLFPMTLFADDNIFYHKNVIYYNGDINQHGFERVKDIHSQHPDVTRITFNSFGGYADVGIDFANWILKRGLDIEVDKYCISSCANYLFLAGKNKYLNRKSFLGWHGGVFQLKNEKLTSVDIYKILNFSNDCNSNALSDIYLITPIDKIIDESLFFKEINVNMLITVYGQVKPVIFYSDKQQLWSYTAEALAYFGVKNIVLLDDKWTPEKIIKGRLVTYFELDEIEKQVITSKFVSEAFISY